MPLETSLKDLDLYYLKGNNLYLNITKQKSGRYEKWNPKGIETNEQRTYIK